VKSFRKLINEVAVVTLNNSKYEMFYRGQVSDYKDWQTLIYNRRDTPRTIIYPTICRPKKRSDNTYQTRVMKKEIIRRYEDINTMIDLISKDGRYRYEYYCALFQHYDILPTPFIDITQSLRVAATFALDDNESDNGYLYVFGLPYPNQSISYFRDSEIVLMKLQNVCPAKALRPRYQEGYLVGKYPIMPTKTGGDNIARRLVAKFKLDNSDGRFWDESFKPMPHEVLYPPNDPTETELQKIKEEFSKLYS